MNKITDLINHVVLVLDASGSMQNHRNTVVKVADEQIKLLAKRSTELNQETRVTVYVFQDRYTINCVFYDKDVLRMPSLRGHYEPLGNTPLVASTLKAIGELKQTPQLYGNHAFLVYVITDGGENCQGDVVGLQRTFQMLEDNWTVAAFVPNVVCKQQAEAYGFPRANIAIWDASGSAEEIGKAMSVATDNYMTARTTGTRGTKNLFNLQVGALDATALKALQSLHAGQYRWLDVQYVSQIAAYVEKLTGRAYKMGEAYYQLTKPEKIQADKSVAVLDQASKKVYVGAEARKLLGLPDYEVKVAPAQHPNYTLFVQSKSVNRKLVVGTKILLLS